MDQPHQQQPEHAGMEGQDGSGVHYCSSHPGVETMLACGKCGNYICPRCMIQTPVGSRCQDCARVSKLPTFDVKPTYYLRAALAGGLSALVAGLVVGVILFTFRGVPFMASIMSIGAGYLVGEAISASGSV